MKGDALVLVGFVLSFACGLGAAVLLAREGYPWLSFVALLACSSIKIKGGSQKGRADR